MGCTRYELQALAPEQVLSELKAVSLADLLASHQSGSTDVVRSWNLSDGLNSDEIVLAALLLNPDLKTKHLKKGVAEGQLIIAGHWPNPAFDTKSLLYSTPHHGTKSLEATLSLEVLRWGERAGERQALKAEVRAVEFEILEEEWLTAMEARDAFWDVVAAREQVKLNAEIERVSSRLLDGVRDQIAKGAASTMDLNQAELEHAHCRSEALRLFAEESTAMRRLRKVLGLPPYAEVNLQVESNPFAPIQPVWTFEQLDVLLADSAPLSAAQWRYQVCEGELRAAVARQYPGLQIGPTGSFDFDSHVWSSLLGFVLTIDLPILNRNQGEIKEKLSARDLARAEYVARFHSARAALAEAVERLKALEEQIQFHEQQVLPRMQESLKVLERAITSGALNTFSSLQTQTALLESKQQYLELLVAHRKALLSVESAAGRRLEGLVEEKPEVALPPRP